MLKSTNRETRLSRNLKGSLLIGAAVLAALFFVKSCQKNECIECVGMNESPEIIFLDYKVLTGSSGFASSKQGKLFVQGSTGKLQPLDKSKELDLRCFSETDYLANDVLKPIDPTVLRRARPLPLEELLLTKERERDLDDYPNDPKNSDYFSFPSDYKMSSNPNLNADGNLWAMDLTWDNTTILFINFDENGRLESRELTSASIKKSGTVFSDLDQIMKESPGSPLNEYKAVQYFLTNLVHGSNPPGRPRSQELESNNFGPRNLKVADVPSDKTPFFNKFTLTATPSGRGEIDAKTGHVFFYVLLDDYLRFQRDHASARVYTPDTAKPMYSPYVLYPTVPQNIPVAPDMTQPVSPKHPWYMADVMTLHFLQGGNMTRDMEGDVKCNYPFDIAVISDGQAGWANKTPLFIDPETETDGSMPK